MTDLDRERAEGIYDDLVEVELRLMQMLRDGEAPEEVLTFTTPSPRHLSDLGRAVYHLGSLTSYLDNRYGIRHGRMMEARRDG